MYDLRKAFHDVLFEAPAERQLELIQQYPDLAGVATREGRLSSRSSMDQAYAGLNQLDSDEYTTFDDLTRAYREKFGFPLVVAVRENTKETILKSRQRPAAELPRRRAGHRAGGDRQDRQPAPARYRRGAGRPAGRVTPG